MWNDETLTLLSWNVSRPSPYVNLTKYHPSPLSHQIYSSKARKIQRPLKCEANGKKFKADKKTILDKRHIARPYVTLSLGWMTSDTKREFRSWSSTSIQDALKKSPVHVNELKDIVKDHTLFQKQTRSQWHAEDWLLLDKTIWHLDLRKNNPT